jgi:large subunit ribosomal protein L34e
MPRPYLRSRSVKKRYVRTPGTTKVHYERRKFNVRSCAGCGNAIHGIPRSKLMSKLSLSEKRVERKFGGFLCHRCLESLIKASLRG